MGLSLLCWRQVYGAHRTAAAKALMTAGDGRDVGSRLLVVKWHTKQADDLATFWRTNAASAGIRDGIRGEQQCQAPLESSDLSPVC